MRKSYRLLSALLAVVLMMALGSTAALADESTTTRKTVYKDIGANTEIYAVTDSAGGDYPYYGELWEPKGGVLYGRTGHGGTLASGRYGLVNLSEAADESIISHYYSLSDAYSLEYWSYLYGQALADGEHALLVCLNFDNEAADCPLVCSGSYDAKLKAAFCYLATLSCPVFLRIGGEMNAWGAVPAAEDFIAAYVHIADLARELAPNVALVFSPNFSAAVGVDRKSVV